MASCGCNKHHIICKDNDPQVFKFTHKKYPKIVQSTLIKKGLITIYTSAICTECANYCLSELVDEPDAKKLKLDHGTIADKTIELLKNGLLPQSEIIKLSHAIGTSIHGDILCDAQKISQQYKESTDYFSITSWISERHPILLSFLSGATGVTVAEVTPSTEQINKTENSKRASLAQAIDCIYKARYQPLVCPMAFKMNLVSYYISGSRLTTNINNSHSPAGSYTCLKNWLREQCTSTVQVNKENDIITYFDNNQVIARNWRVNFNYKCKASVVTTTVHIEPSVGSNLQKDESMSPARWLYGVSNKSNVLQLINKFISKSNDDFIQIRNDYISKTINDIIEKNYQRNIENESKDPYSFVPSGHDGSPKLTTGEPCFYNPCSYDSVKKVMHHILQQTGVGEAKKWTVMGCDGLPFVLGSRLIENDKELQNIMLIPGHGHYEINIVKGLFKLLWNVCLEDIAKMLGYRSIRALTCCEKCTDHHKAWMIIQIFMKGCMEEILNDFFSHCNNVKGTPSLKTFYKYVSACKNPNFRFIFDIVFTYLVALEVYRAGIRRHNVRYILAGRCKLSELFYGLNQTMYQEIEYRDLKRRVLCPHQLNTSGNCTESFTISGNESKGEGGDFILEGINKKTKKWLPKGFPSEQDWLKVCKNLDKLEKIRQNLESELQLEDNIHHNIYRRNTEKEVSGWREILRNSKYLQDINDKRPHKSISGKELDKELRCFETKCQRNRDQYFTAIEQGSKPGKGIQLEPLFVIPENRSIFHDITKKTKAQLSDMILALLRDLREYDRENESDKYFEKWNKEVKVSKKDEMIRFYQDVAIAMENATDRNDNSDDDDDDEEDGSNKT